ncbi:YwmB family TATA-box binding protein [Tumebacillus permanentifrigoris]|uniref:TATA-box binding protein n=1 Tax=Tumebacillus permanentifrigoris TaxID=378543 RepID=A0A316E0C2_9BACL|nr:YwmB family TATA-box binding protein [Tumebacillus permanentifrigoris]PWK16250.1 TATA-box binding protein [Tumebacillus permanentifrigoris]
MKRIGIYGIILCLLLATYSIVQARQQTVAGTADTGEFLAQAFAATKADVEGYSVHNWSVIDKEFRSQEQLKALGQKLNKTFAIQAPKETLDGGGDQNSYTLRGTRADGGTAQIVLTSMKFQDRSPQTALVLTVDRDAQDLGGFQAAIQEVRETVSAANAIPQISTCIKGLLADKMSDGASSTLIRDVFQDVKAKEIEGVRSELVTSLSGYSPLTKDYIVTNGNRMNLQVAVHYDAHLDRTRVLVGSPIVTIEY